MARALNSTSMVLLLTSATLAGCHSCAGIADLEIGEGGGGGSTVTGTAGSTESTPASSSSAGEGGGTSTGTAGPPCDGGACEPGQFCEVVRPPQGDDLQTCKDCGDVPPAPPIPAEECPGYCLNDCDQRCDTECTFSSPNCDALGVELDAKITNMVLLCEPGGLCGTRVTCTGPLENTGPGPFDCHVICSGEDACSFLELDCSGHSGRCILECSGGACGNARVTCGANECIVCGDPDDPPEIEEAGTCKLTQADACGGLILIRRPLPSGRSCRPRALTR